MELNRGFRGGKEEGIMKATRRSKGERVEVEVTRTADGREINIGTELRVTTNIPLDFDIALESLNVLWESTLASLET
jgi:hypothetical protein